ncbi:MAG: hypothetical protein JNM17_18740 [Archangium sp.]|nr:hypothetical protein [Archangium sp.]
MRFDVLAVAVLVLSSSGCVDNKKKMREAQAKRDAEKLANEKAKEQKIKDSAPKVDRAKLGPEWDSPDFLKIGLGRPAPEGFWSIFPGAPGDTPDEIARNEAKRAELAQKMKDSTFVVILTHGNGVTMRKYNAKKKQLTIEVDGLVDFYDKLGQLSAAWGEPAKAFRPKQPDDDEEEPTNPQAVWRAQPLLFPVPFPNAKEANAFRDKEGLGLEVRLVFTLGKIEIDTKTQKSAMPLPDAGAVSNQIDYGAGRLVHVQLKGVRVSTDFEKKLIAEKK